MDAMKHVLLILLTVFVMNSYFINAQIINTNFNEHALQLRVKQLDEFRKRFNYETDIQGKKPIDKNDTLIHKKYIMSLFDVNLYKDSTHLKIINSFSNQVISRQTKQNIQFTDSDWYAQVYCSIKYNGLIKKISLILKPQKIKEYEYKWVIIGAYADFLNIEPTKKNNGLMLSPVDNEINFMTLADVINNNSVNILNYVNTEFEPDYLSLFLYLVKNKSIQFNTVERILYHFLQIPNYIFVVQHFERNNGNSGWLVSDIAPADISYKKDYIIKTLKLKK